MPRAPAAFLHRAAAPLKTAEVRTDEFPLLDSVKVVKLAPMAARG